jgi:epoxyqueuosine reductase
MAPETAAALTPTERATRVKDRARALGFDTVGITDLRPVAHAEALDRWLEYGYAGTMRYLHRQAARRKRPDTIIPGMTRAILVTRNYHNPDPAPRPQTGRVAKYARGRDYHLALRPALDALCRDVESLGPPGTHARAFVDAGPVPERELAQRAGLGWIGKNTMLIDPRRGSFFFLAAVLTDLEVGLDAPFEADRCGTCTRCLDACPTEAFPAPHVLDATRCISYLTIEHRGEIPRSLVPRMDDWIFGCDICQDVCPWNLKFATPAHAGGLHLDSGRGRIPLDSFIDMDEQTFDAHYGWTPLERPGIAGMRRNAEVARANVRGEVR